jgi:tetratricopeptide (TPR) repeat protein
MKTLVWLVAVAGAIATTVPVGSVPSAHAQADDEESQLLVEAARRAIGKKDYVRAGELLDKALSVNPRRIDLYVLRASVYGVRKEYDQGIALLEKAQKLAPDNASVTTSLGVQLVQSGQADRGVPILEKMVAKQPRRYDAQVVLGHHYASQAMWPEAAAAFQAYFDHRPSEIAGEDHLHKSDYANARLRAGEPNRARELYEEVLEKNPKSEIARLGVAWSAAAIDCREALPLFEGLADLETKYGEVSLVRGRCALLLGRLDEALAAAERYRKAKSESGEGWELLGDVHVGKKNFTAAETAYGKAVAAEPDDKVYAFKLGRTERALGKTQAAADRLAKTGAPRDFEADWTIEYGEALYTLGQVQVLRVHIEPWAESHPDSAVGQFLLGVSLYDLGEVSDAVVKLEQAAGGEPRAKAPLIAAYNTLAVASVKDGKLAEARTLLERAEGVGDDVLTWRNLGAILISQGSAADLDKAVKILKKAVDKDRDDAVAQHLLARAYQATKKYDEARGAYGKAIKGYGKDKRIVAAQLDLANAELASGRGEQAVDTLESALGGAHDADTKAMLSKALIEAARDAGTDAMRSGRFSTAVRVLKAVEKRVSGDDATEVRCDLALASTGNGQRDVALEHLKKLEKAKAKCPFVAPADELAVPILIAWNEGATLRKARKALERLEKLRSKARGVAEPLARLAARDIALRAAQEAYGNGNLKSAGKFLADAKLYDKRSPELAHNLAVIDLSNGDVDEAIRELERVKDEVPEAYVNLGIAYDRKHDPTKALEYWRKAQALGVRFKSLDDWIETKQRFWGGGQ